MYDVDRLLRLNDGKIRVIGLFAEEYQPDDYSGRYELIKTGYDDNSQAGEEELNAVARIADRAADIFSSRLRSGKSCLSSCAAGLNRSGIVSALTLMKLAGLDPARAIDTVRKSRAPQQGMAALSNPRFVEIIHRMGPTTGSKSTWTHWKS